MPFVFSEMATRQLDEADRCIVDVRNKPIKDRDTKFQLAQQNMLAYTFGEFIPGFAAHTVNTMSYREVVERPVKNADEEGHLFFDRDYSVSANARAKVDGDIFETVSASIMWNIAARWNRYMAGGSWAARSGYPKPPLRPDPSRQVAVLNLPRNFDWVRLLTPNATASITGLRNELATSGLRLPTSTPDLAVVVLPQAFRSDDKWRTDLADLTRPNQAVLQLAYRDLLGSVEPAEILLAVAFKRSLRSDRLYQPLYEANIMQLLLEGHLGAPQVEFEVHTLGHLGTDARSTYEAASLYSVLAPERVKHRAVRELYEPQSAQEVARRLLAFLSEREA